MPSRRPFVAVYYSDGTYEAYHNSRTAANDEERQKAEPVYGLVFDDKPITGKWDTEDGFFTLQNDGQREYVGTVSFSSNEWEAGQKGNQWTNEDGTTMATGPALFRGMNYEGEPGGRIKVAEAVGDPNAM